MEFVEEERDSSFIAEESVTELSSVDLTLKADSVLEGQMNDLHTTDSNCYSLGNQMETENGPELFHAENLTLKHNENDTELSIVNDVDSDSNANDLNSDTEVSHSKSNIDYASAENEMDVESNSNDNYDDKDNVNDCKDSESSSTENNDKLSIATENNSNDDTKLQDDSLQNSTTLENNKRPADEDLIDLEPSVKKKASELDLLWVNVNNSSDFQAWTDLLQYVERVKVLDSGREAYDRFFAHYPYCYGYWKKYVDLEKKEGTDESVMKVFDRGLKAVNLSVDLWVFYMEYVMSKFASDHEFVREQFDRAVENCGMDFKADRLWEMYISWESAEGRWSRLVNIYDRLIMIPLSKHGQHWDKYQALLNKHPLKDLLSREQFAKLRKSVAVAPEIEETSPSEDVPPGVESDLSTEAEIDECKEEDLKLMSKAFIEEKQKLYNLTLTAAKERWSFEDAIKRPYFHVKPLERCQLNAWRNYLDFEIKAGDFKRITTLFRRCLIATALYEEFWMKFVRFLEDNSAPEDEIRDVYVNACTIHLKHKLRPHLSWVAFEEQRGNYEAALSILEDLQSSHCENLELYMVTAAIERRRGRLDLAEQIFVDCLDKFDSDEKKKKLHSNVALKYSRFLVHFKDDTEQAVAVINKALEIDDTNLDLLVALADTAMSCRPIDVELAVEALRKGTEVASSSEHKLAFAYRYLHFVTEFDCKMGRMNEAMKMVEQIRNEISSSRSTSNQGHSNAHSNTTSHVTKPVKTGLMPTPVPPTMIGSPMDKHHPAQSPLMPTPSMNGAPMPSGAPSAAYGGYQPNHQQSGYGGSYPQYSNNYGAGNQYQNWNYAGNQQGSYGGYNQQPWSGYSGYYAGQR